jgi:hypothetical protein
MHVHLGLQLPFEYAQSFIFALLGLSLTQNLEFVVGRVIGLNKEWQGILKFFRARTNKFVKTRDVAKMC